MKRAFQCAMDSRARVCYVAHGKSLDRISGRRLPVEEAVRWAHQRSGRHEKVSVNDRFGDSSSSRLPRVYA